MDPRMVFAERRRRGLSGQSVAKQLGITREAYSQIERGLIGISQEYAAQIENAIEAAAAEAGNGG